MKDIDGLKADAENNPDDWEVRLQLSQAYKDLGKTNEALLALWGNPMAPMTMSQSRRVKELRSELDPDGEIDLGAYVPPVSGEVMDGEDESVQIAAEMNGEESVERSIVLAGDVDPGAIKPHEKSSDAAQKVSALTAALAVHLLIALLLGLVVISMPLTEISKFTLIPSDTETKKPIDVPSVPRVSRMPTPSSMAHSTSVISSVAPAMMAVPDFDQTESLDVTRGMTFQDMETIWGFRGKGMDQLENSSEVNFFDIRSRGNRMVFIIEASRYMLTDKKGGIPAYNKVKDELAMILSGLNRQTAFNLILYDGKKIATYRDELVAATPSNVRQAIEWFDPINQDFESIGLGESYTSQPVQSGIEPMLVNDLVHYIKATQRALEMDVDTIFLLSNGWGWHRKSMEPREYEKWMKKKNWGEKEEKDWAENIKKAREWLIQENKLRMAKGIPRRVVTSLNEIVSEILPGVRHKPGPSYSMDDVQDQLKNAVSRYYRAKGKPRPRFNVVWFVGENESPNLMLEAHLKHQAKRNRGRMNVLKGMAGLENVSQ